MRPPLIGESNLKNKLSIEKHEINYNSNKGITAYRFWNHRPSLLEPQEQPRARISQQAGPVCCRDKR